MRWPGGDAASILLRKETESPWHPLPCSQMIVGAPSLARAASRRLSPNGVRPRAPEQAMQCLRKFRRVISIKLSKKRTRGQAMVFGLLPGLIIPPPTPRLDSQTGHNHCANYQSLYKLGPFATSIFWSGDNRFSKTNARNTSNNHGPKRDFSHHCTTDPTSSSGRPSAAERRIDLTSQSGSLERAQTPHGPADTRIVGKSLSSAENLGYDSQAWRKHCFVKY